MLKYLRKNNLVMFIFFALAFFYILSCGTRYLPKPKGYNKITLPKHDYYPINDSFPFSFEVSKMAEVKKSSIFKNEPYWVDLLYNDYGAQINITYKEVKSSKNNLSEFINDTYKLINKHQIKASAIKETIIQTPSNKKATIIELSGEVPTQFQFHITDSNKHFLRGALYFNTATKNDSLAPVIDYIKVDIIHLINSLKWNE